MKPDFTIKVNNSQFKWEDRVEHLSLSDEAGFICDEMSMNLDDSDGSLAIPGKGVSLTVAIGYRGEIYEYGQYTVDDCDVGDGRIRVKAKGFDTSSKLKTLRSETYEHSFTSAVKAIAARNGLEPCIDGEMKEYYQDNRFMQNKESDMNFLSRTCRAYNAYFKIVGKKLCVLRRGSGVSVGGADLGRVVVERNYVESDWSFKVNYRDTYSCIKADYIELGTGAIREIVIGKGSPEKKLFRRFSDKKLAENEAKAVLAESGFDGASFTFTLGIGDPRIRSETKIDASGFKEGIDGVWIVKRVTHEISKSAYKTYVECMKPVERSQ